ncbi:MFS transporter [Streptomyces sp. NPDC093109]|uniref:MFS transporter n=1 Tax=Streptomyces sp. NPDC093109 TaxID=3154977 RepID=UPI00344CBEDC
MLTVLRDRTYRHLFTAQVIALVGTGLATVALSLLAHDLAGADASAVLGTALAVKMVAYVGVAPVVGALAGRLPRRTLLVSMDLTRAAVALALPFVSQVWQVYVLVFVLQCASAAFTPAFQATIPLVLPAERDYTRALSLSRLAYDLESLLSPALAAALLSVMSYNWLFAGTTAGFLASGALVVSVLLPTPVPASAERAGGVFAKVSSGTRLFLATPRLRALLPLDLAVAAGGAMVTVNTVVLVRDHLGRAVGDVSLALGAYGAGSLTAALVLPRLLERVSDRALMLPAAFATAGLLTVLALGTAVAPGPWAWPALLVAWALLGTAASVVLTPSGRLLRRSATDADLPAVFAARFSLSHGCWLLTYPLAGWLAAGAGMPVAATALAVVALAAAVTALALWPRTDPARTGRPGSELPAGGPCVTLPATSAEAPARRSAPPTAPTAAGRTPGRGPARSGAPRG